MIVDTTALVDLIRGLPAARAEVERLEAEGTLLWVPTPALFELWEGVERADRPEEERRTIEAVLEDYTVLSFKDRHAERAGRVSGALIRQGRMLDPIDSQLAGMALEERSPVLTRNREPFERVSGLEVVTY